MAVRPLRTQLLLDKYFLPLFSIHKKAKYVRGLVRQLGAWKLRSALYTNLALTHYGDPYHGACLSDERNVEGCLKDHSNRNPNT